MTTGAVGDPLPPGCQTIEVHIGELNQLFNAMDPAPFRDRDLDPNAEEFIVGWARELHHDRPLALVVHLDRETGTPEGVAVLKDAVRRFFVDRARVTRQKLRQLFRTGRLSLLIGLVFVVATVLGGDLLASAMKESRFSGVVRESLLIGGWVAMWRPLEGVPVRLVADSARGAVVRSARRDARSAGLRRRNEYGSSN